MIYDTIIIGGGPAGLSAAIYLARQKLKTLILTIDVGGQTALSSEIENYLGFESINGMEFIEKCRKQVEKYQEVEIKEGVVVAKIKKNGFFTVATTEGESFQSKTVLIASGKLPRTLGVKGEAELSKKGVTYCATCDAPLYRNKTTAVIGGGNSALDAILQLSKIAVKVYAINKNPDFKGDEILRQRVKECKNVEIINNAETLEIMGDKKVSGVKIKVNGQEKTINLEGVFIEVGSNPSSGFAETEKKQVE
ncbi:MAG: FAD-dependent oxidoreductase [Candidatus Marsarchaeota archaeon]|nr:FAD-dependent oxidoreductase [Candidatus Marsarchaeota archaeon]